MSCFLLSQLVIVVRKPIKKNQANIQPKIRVAVKASS